MFRSQFPDSPNLFTSYQRLGRPSILLEFRRTWLISTIGIVFLLAGIGLLVWNEGRAVQMARSLEEGHRKILVPDTTDVVFEENNGKLVLLAGSLKIEDALEDPVYEISIRAVKLRKKVQMYQWYEVADQNSANSNSHSGDHDSHTDITYSYDKGWFDYPISSLSFNNPMGHHNPEYWAVNSTSRTNQRVKLGGFLLGQQLKEKFNKFSQFTSDERPSDSNIKMHAGLYFHAKDVWEPDIGDLRVQFSYAGKDGDQVTVVGKQSGKEIRPYVTHQGDELLFLQPGIRKASDVFQAEHNQNRVQLWIYRAGGWFASFFGFNCILPLLEILIDDHPSIRRIFVLGVTSLPFSLSVSTFLLAIGFGWALYRPLLALGFFGVAVAPMAAAAYKKFRLVQEQRRHRH